MNEHFVHVVYQGNKQILSTTLTQTCPLVDIEDKYA